MSQQRVVTSFDEIIQADRQRRKNEDLAKEIFGKNKHNDTSKRKDAKKQSSTPSLASRIGITKRSSSTSISGANSPRSLPVRPSSAAAQHARQNRLAEEIDKLQTTNIVAAKSNAPALMIKGSAAPFVVEARNFAPGTSEADITSVVHQSSFDAKGKNTFVSCKIIATKPVVVAELVFSDRAIADKIVNQYNNRVADGHVLELHIARSGPGSMSKHHSKPTKGQAPITSQEAVTPAEDDNMMEDIDTDLPVAHGQDSYNQEREAAEKGRRDRDSRRDRDDYDATERRDDDDRRGTEQERGSDRSHERDRDRGYERSDRDDRSSYRRDESGTNRSSHYGNGVGSSGRPAYGGGYAGGRGQYPGYGGFGGRGSFRGGYRGYR